MHALRRAERGGHVAAPRAEVVFVEDHERGAVFLGELRERNPGDGDDPVFFPLGAARPHVRGHVVEICHGRKCIETDLPRCHEN